MIGNSGRGATVTVAALLLGTPAWAASRLPQARIADAILAALVESSGVPGMGASIWQNGKIVWTGSAGLRDVEARLPVTRETRFRFASVSKLFTVVAAAKLREQGKLDAEAPISSMLPYLPPAWRTITSAQLAAHTAGVPHYQAMDEERGKQHFTTVRAAAAQVVLRPLLAAPGTAYSYSSWGYVLLSAVVEAQAGKPFLDVLANDIAPSLALGPDTTGLSLHQASRAYEFAAHTAVEAPAHDFSYTWGGGGLGGTAPALATFGGRLLGGRPVSRSTLEWMQTPARLADGTLVRDQDYTVGFGWRRSTDLGGRRILHHAGSAIGARSALLLYPEQATAVALLSNASWTSAIEQSAQMLAAPFFPQPSGKTGTACPVRATSHRTWEKDETTAPISRPVQFSVIEGVCTGRIPMPPELAARLAGFPQASAHFLTIVGTDLNGGLSQAALVTPMGAYPMISLGSGRFQAQFGEQSRLTIQFE